MKIRQMLLQEGYQPLIVCSARDCGGESSLNLGALGAVPCDLMALDSNALKGFDGRSLPHFTPRPSPESSGVNVLAQNLPGEVAFLDSPYVFPPPRPAFVGPVLRHLERHHRSCTMVVLDLYPRKYWWPLIQKYSTKSCRLAHRGDHNALLKPSTSGCIPLPGLPGDLWAFDLNFHWGKTCCNVVALNWISTVIE